jgi:hypothetical protein
MNPVKDEAFRQTPRAVSRLRFTPEKLLNLSMVGVAGFCVARGDARFLCAKRLGNLAYVSPNSFIQRSNIHMRLHADELNVCSDGLRLHCQSVIARSKTAPAHRSARTST